MKVTTRKLAHSKMAVLSAVLVVLLIANTFSEVSAAAPFDYRNIAATPPTNYVQRSAADGCVPGLGTVYKHATESPFIPTPVLAYYKGKLSAIIYDIRENDISNRKTWEMLQPLTVPDALGRMRASGQVPMVDHVDFKRVGDTGRVFFQLRIYFLTHQEQTTITCGITQRAPRR